MEQREAQAIIRMVESNWHFDLGAQGRELWRDAIEPYDAALATAAVAALARQPLPGGRARPVLADLRQVLIRIARDQAERESWRGLPPEPLGRPSWVTRWERARAAGDARLFPEQAPGLIALQKGDPANAAAYRLPSAPETDAEVWVQPDEYAERAA